MNEMLIRQNIADIHAMLNKAPDESQALENYLLEWGSALPVDLRNAILDQLIAYKS